MGLALYTLAISMILHVTAWKDRMPHLEGGW
jgi:hypothetical protein